MKNNKSCLFRDRIEAGLLLAEKLQKFNNDPCVVLAVPRGGVPVAYMVAKELTFPLSLILTKKIGHPANKEYAIGAASLSDYFIIPHKNVTEEYIQQEVKAIRNRLKDMYRKFMGPQEPVSLEGKTVIVVDDGIATGNTLLATIQVLRKTKPRKIVIAVPVASRPALNKLAPEVHEVVTLQVPEVFDGVGAYYEDFEEVSDREVLFYLNKIREFRSTG